MIPFGHKILVLPIIEEKSKGGLIIPPSGKKDVKGKIIKVGTKVKQQEWEGRIAHYYEHSGFSVNYNGQSHLILKCGPTDSEVIAIE